MDDAELTRLALDAVEGGDGAVEQLVRRLRPDVARFIGSMSDPMLVEELTQETLIRALRGLPRFAARSSVRSWILSIARHTVVDRYRAASARPATVSVEDWDTAQARTETGQGRFEEELALLNLLTGLTETRRTAFVLTQIEGFSYAEAAEITRVPVGTVRSRVARAREDLITALRLAEIAEAAETPAPVATAADSRDSREPRAPRTRPVRQRGAARAAPSPLPVPAPPGPATTLIPTQEPT
ncbi:sigma-70 family RNA polymerase sigma factor [Streptomonospora sp. S1-112]|uniref:RNA polymerase sigma factor n=1 Tax=Streptomonospora mangrovi TaxID=2883123 RepID=A0A9X3SJK6_9ACTN|nr:sigma-70 family RNA polymerase sigma factor [Streptomonospora mangrovi]MDA0567449.1 sigma-70 family RNA polymerase sigma factor [Streptomonospora mangrovi]